MYNTETQSKKIIKLLTEKEKKPKKKTEREIFAVKGKKKKYNNK